MKKLRNILMIAAVSALSNIISTPISAQTDKATTIKLIEGKNFVFNATTASPTNTPEINAIFSKMPGSLAGGVINLAGSTYSVSVDKDSVEANLPYYGRSFNAPRNLNDGGIKVSGGNFSYKADKKKKGNYIVVVKPGDSKGDVLSMTFFITETGYATLNVVSNYRQAISYNGYISDPAKLASK
ncbi:MAG: DUF4251 domain-containing protein [Pedobacter sp.]|nr:MAG: DUF4251 domain-containing protein [Pedobacter sp.]